MLYVDPEHTVDNCNGVSHVFRYFAGMDEEYDEATQSMKEVENWVNVHEAFPEHNFEKMYAEDLPGLYGYSLTLDMEGFHDLQVALDKNNEESLELTFAWVTTDSNTETTIYDRFKLYLIGEIDGCREEMLEISPRTTAVIPVVEDTVTVVESSGPESTSPCDYNTRLVMYVGNSDSTEEPEYIEFDGDEDASGENNWPFILAHNGLGSSSDLDSAHYIEINWSAEYIEFLTEHGIEVSSDDGRPVYYVNMAFIFANERSKDADSSDYQAIDHFTLEIDGTVPDVTDASDCIYTTLEVSFEGQLMYYSVPV
jgi:hypothetical protein